MLPDKKDEFETKRAYQLKRKYIRSRAQWIKYCIQEYIHPFRPRCQKANLRLCEFYITNNISVNTTATGELKTGRTRLQVLKSENNTRRK